MGHNNKIVCCFCYNDFDLILVVNTVPRSAKWPSLVNQQTDMFVAGQMKPALQAKMPQSHCSLGSREYPEPMTTVNKSKKKPYGNRIKMNIILNRSLWSSQHSTAIQTYQYRVGI